VGCRVDVLYLATFVANGLALHIIAATKPLCCHYRALETSEGHISTPAHSLVSSHFLTTESIRFHPLFNGKVLSGAMFCVALSKVEERSELGVKGRFKNKTEVPRPTYLPFLWDFLRFLGLILEHIFMVFLGSSCRETAEKRD
jgi:hypothetical protein